MSSQFRGVPGGSGEFRGRCFFNVYFLPRVPGSSGEVSLTVAKQRFSEEKESQPRIRSLCRNRELRPILPIFKEKSVFVENVACYELHSCYAGWNQNK